MIVSLMRKCWKRRVAMSVAALVLVGCSNNSSSRATQPQGPARRITNDTPSLTYLAIALDVDTDRQRRQETLTQECMEKRGWQYYPKPPVELPEGVNTQERDQPDRTFVLRYGYGIARRPTPTSPGQQNAPDSTAKPSRQDQYEQQLSKEDRQGFDDYMASLWGKPEDRADGRTSDASVKGYDPALSCAGQARFESFGKLRPLSGEIQGLINDIEPRVMADRRVLAAQEKWSACVAKHGYNFRTRTDAKNSLQTQTSSMDLRDTEAMAKFHKAERELAIVDYDCYIKHLQQVTRTTRRDLENQLLKDHPEVALAINNIKKVLDQAKNTSKK